ncbi:hypothetical protein F2P44_16170 [Massilia sp. CCM 8695]|uniref:DUF4280 domain-containing protein n=1 Tax=Massilia frigida TaxID=2609281 RepID=A0ABX0NE57_9BURK|nr:hypothetical protein [Massilia frigida]NHZ80797.1 hypothetical protein [Massilia frigida]
MIPILTTSSSVMCPHGGQAILVTSNAEMILDGAPALLQTDSHLIVGCAFVPAAPSPCTSIRWITGAAQATVHGVPVLLQNSIGLCLNALQAPQGIAIVVQVQQNAKGL